MKRVLILAAIIAAPAFAQQPTQAEQESELRRQATAEQRNQNADVVAALSARLRVVEAELERAKKAAEACKVDEKK